MRTLDINNALKDIAKDIKGDHLESAKSIAFIRIFSRLPLYFDPGYLFEDPETEMKYLEKMSNLETLLRGFSKDPALFNTQFKSMCDWINELKPRDDKQHFKYIISAYKYGYGYTINSPLYAFIRAYNMIETIFNHKTSEHYSETIKFFNKYMFNLITVGRKAALTYNGPRTKNSTPRIPNADKYYMASLDDPNLDLVLFLTNGPLSMFYYSSEDNHIHSVWPNHDLRGVVKKYSKYSELGPYDRQRVCHFHRWNESREDAECERNFKLLFPNPVNMFEIFMIPY